MDWSNRLLFSIAMLISVIGLGAWGVPRLIGIYYQVQGGSLLRQVIDGPSVQSKTSSFPCLVDSNTLSENDKAQTREAVFKLQEAVRIAPQLSQPYLLLGRAYCYLGEKVKALDAYQAYIEKRPNNPIGHLEYSFALETSGEDAITVLEWRSAGIDSEDFMSRAHEERNAREYYEAIKWYERAYLLGNSTGRLYSLYSQGQYYEQQGLWQESLSAYRETITADHYTNLLTGSAYYRIGLIQQVNLNQWSDAFTSYGEAVIAGSFLSSLDRADSHYRLGIIQMYALNEPREAMQEFQLAIQALSYHYGALIELGTAYWQVDQNFDLAERTLKVAIGANPGGKWAYLTLGHLYIEYGDFEKGLYLYEKALVIDPTDEEIAKRIRQVKDQINSSETQ